MRGIDNDNFAGFGSRTAESDGGKKVETNITKETIQKRKSLNQMHLNTTFVLLPIVVSGTGQHGQMSCSGDCDSGGAFQFFSF